MQPGLCTAATPGDELHVGFRACRRLLLLLSCCSKRAVLSLLHCAVQGTPSSLHEPLFCCAVLRGSTTPTLRVTGLHVVGGRPIQLAHTTQHTLSPHPCVGCAPSQRQRLHAPATQLVVSPVSRPSTAPPLHSALQSGTCSQAPVALSMGATARATVAGATSNTVHVHQALSAVVGGSQVRAGPGCVAHSTVPLSLDCCPW